MGSEGQEGMRSRVEGERAGPVRSPLYVRQGRWLLREWPPMVSLCGAWTEWKEGHLWAGSWWIHQDTERRLDSQCLLKVD